MGPVKNYSIEQLKAFRVEVDACIQFIENEQENGSEEGTGFKNYHLYSQASYQVEVKLREAKMWIGKMMEGYGSELPAEFRDQATKTQ